MFFSREAVECVGEHHITDTVISDSKNRQVLQISDDIDNADMTLPNDK